MVSPRNIYNSQQQMNLAQKWFWYVEHCWYPAFVTPLPDPGDSVKYINEFLDAAWQHGDADRALFEIGRLQQHKIRMDHFEKVISYKLCGHVFLAMEDRVEAEKMIHEALIWIPRNYKHYVGVINWLLGILHWLQPDQHAEAINNWKSAIKEFHEISIDPSLAASKKDWYLKTLKEMRDTFRRAIEIDQLPNDTSLQCPGMPKRRGFRAPGQRFAADAMDPEAEDESNLQRLPEPQSPAGKQDGDTEPTAASREAGDEESGEGWYNAPEIDKEIELPDFLIDKEERDKPRGESDLPGSSPPDNLPGEEGDMPVSSPPDTPPDEPPPISQQERPEASDGMANELPEQTEADKLRGFRLLPPDKLPADGTDWRIPISVDVLPPDTSPISPYVQGYLELFKVQDEIVTSPFDEIIPGTKEMPSIEISIVRIGSKDYNIHFLGKHRTKRIVNIDDEDTYFLKIKGKSMNAAGIEEGDYVIIKRQNTAQDRDIVAAIIRDENDPLKSKASLKRFLTGQKMGNEKSKANLITLKAESFEEEFKDWEWSFSPEQQNEDDGFTIFGVVIAYLKPIN